MSEEAEKGTEGSTGSGYSGRRLSEAEFEEACELYELGKATLGTLAESYGISRQALSKRFKDARIVKGSRAYEAAAAAAAAAKASPSPSAAAAIERFADKRSDWIEETRIEGVNSLKQARLIARKIVADQMRAGAPLHAIDDDLKAVQRLNKILCDNIGTVLEILRANDHVDETTLPSLKIEDLTDEDILKHHKEHGVVPENATVEDMLAEDIEIGEI